MECRHDGTDDDFRTDGHEFRPVTPREVVAEQSQARRADALKFVLTAGCRIESLAYQIG